jgi:hypothetical protein
MKTFCILQGIRNTVRRSASEATRSTRVVLQAARHFAANAERRPCKKAYPAALYFQRALLFVTGRRYATPA